MNNYVITDKRNGMNLCGRYIVGIDVGVGGYIALLNIDTFAVQFFPLPVTYYFSRKKNKAGETCQRRRRRIDEKKLIALINRLAQPMTLSCVVEHQAPFPGGQGIASTSKLLYLYGLIKGMIMQTNILIETPKPVQWKRALGLIAPRAKNGQVNIPVTTYQKKCKAWELCVHLFPELREKLIPKTYSFDKAE